MINILKLLANWMVFKFPFCFKTVYWLSFVSLICILAIRVTDSYAQESYPERFKAVDSNLPGQIQVKTPKSSQFMVQVLKENWFDARRNRTVQVKIYLPQNCPEKCPVIIFSHGLGGSRDSAEYLGMAWARHGFVGVFLQHPGSDASLCATEHDRAKIVEKLKSAANGKAGFERVQDVHFAIDQLEKLSLRGSNWGVNLDLTRIGMSGHSFGARTSLWIAGESVVLKPGSATKTFGDPRVGAAIYLSPGKYSGLLTADQAYSGIKIPGMIITGSEDTDPIRGSKPKDRVANFDYIKAHDQYLLFFEGAAHQTFGGRSRNGAQMELDERTKKLVSEVSLKFFDAYLLHKQNALNWMKSKELDQYLSGYAFVKQK